MFSSTYEPNGPETILIYVRKLSQRQSLIEIFFLSCSTVKIRQSEKWCDTVDKNLFFTISFSVFILYSDYNTNYLNKS